MKLLDKINLYGNLHSEIIKSFGVEPDWYQIESQTDVRWYLESDSQGIEWLDENGTEYGYEMANKLGESEGLALFLIQGNGEKFYAIFKDDLKFEDYNAFEEQMRVKINS